MNKNEDMIIIIIIIMMMIATTCCDSNSSGKPSANADVKHETTLKEPIISKQE